MNQVPEWQNDVRTLKSSGAMPFGAQLSRAITTFVLASLALCPCPTTSADDSNDGSFVVGQANPQKGWVTDRRIEPQTWKAIEQPDLTSQIENAPQLELEDVLPGPRMVKTEGPWFAPNDDGSWDILILYRSTYMGPKEMVAIDAGTGKVHIEKTNDLDDARAAGRNGAFLRTARFSFHLRSHYYTGGKLFFDCSGYTCPWVAYDPREDRFVWAAELFSYRGDERKIAAALGEDGKIYGMVYKPGAGCIAYSIDPDTYAIEKSEPFGPKDVPYIEYYQSAATDGHWLYAEFGARPWYIVGYNFKTCQGRILGVTQDLQPDQTRLDEFKGSAGGYICNAVKIHGVEDFDPNRFDFWLHNGQVYNRRGDIPPWSDEPVEPREPHYPWDTNCWFMGQQAHWGTFDPTRSLPPEVDPASIEPGPGNVVRLRFRSRGANEDWQTVEYRVQDYPGVCRHVVEINENIICSANEGYGQTVFFDIAHHRELGRVTMTEVSPYSMNVFTTDKLYVSGYPTSQMWELDLMKPLGGRERNDNPKFLGYLAEEADIHTPLAGTLQGADGRIYNAGTTMGRRRTGGGFCWYDPATGATGGKSLGEHRVFWATTACQGRYILFSSKGSDPRLICWDTLTSELVYQKKILDGDRPGPIVEALPGLIIGHHANGELYGLDAATGEVLWTKKLPAPPVTALSSVRRHSYTFRRGPEGAIWATVGGTLVRIDPLDAMVTPLGKVPAAQLAFAAGQVFIAGDYHLRRVKGLKVKMVEASAR